MATLRERFSAGARKCNAFFFYFPLHGVEGTAVDQSIQRPGPVYFENELFTKMQ